MAGLVVHKDAVSHPLLGRAHVIENAGRPITAMSEIDWDAPREIPAIAEPRALPPGSGTLLLNDLAERAQRAGVQKLRYAGPYPTHALFASLLRSFRTTGSVEDFTRDALDRAIRIARDEVPIDFTPAPFARRGDVDVRDGKVDRVRVDGVTYDTEEQPFSLARLVDDTALLTVGIPIALVAKLDGETIVEVQPIPTFETAANGTELPQALRDELADVGDLVPAPLVDDVSRAIATRSTRWENLGWRASRTTDEGFALHVGFLALAGHDMALFAQQISYHLAMIAQQTVLTELLESRR